MTKIKMLPGLLRRAGVLAGVLGATTGLLMGRSSAAQNPETFSATASAYGGRVEYTAPGMTVDRVIDGGGPISQAYADSRAIAVSFASLPYPGENALALPGLISASTGQPPPPAYPFYVRASNPATPEQEMKDPSAAYRLLARAADRQASAIAQLRNDTGEGSSASGSGSRAVTSIQFEKETLTASAETIDEALSFGGGALRIASIRSRSVTTHHVGTNDSQTTTSLIIEGGSAGGYSFAVGPQGLVVANQAVPLAPASGLDQLNAALKTAGISLGFGEERSSQAGVAKTFEIRLRQDAPDPIPPTVVTVRFGGAASTITHSAGEAVPELPPIPTPENGTVPADQSSPIQGSSSSQPGPAMPDPASSAAVIERPALQHASAESSSTAGIVPSDAPAPAAGPGATSGSGEPADDQRLAAAPQGNRLIDQPRALPSRDFIYGVLLAGGILLMVVSTLWRGKGGIQS
jgi:hypothetical protein